MRIGYRPLYEKNEYVHNAKDAELKGLVVQVTGSEEDSKTVQTILGSFKALKSFADFNAPAVDVDEQGEAGVDVIETLGGGGAELPGALKLEYGINLHLPATSDVAVFNAIFRSLREHLLR